MMRPFEAFPRTDSGHDLPSHPAIAGSIFFPHVADSWVAGSIDHPCSSVDCPCAHHHS
ncbi:unnamed protein product [Prunus armeniaca]|uniref:Uncharacterized protein n=1 Tax=Prunus armeniaca TaxID=36596 RepID=A0A6J5XYJ9_PRUAR|nr:unnamed protein product [Prunus armeniaca]CAB4317327.1 unnamed protein product [Prunus armeniaca]